MHRCTHTSLLVIHHSCSICPTDWPRHLPAMRFLKSTCSLVHMSTHTTNMSAHFPCVSESLRAHSTAHSHACGRPMCMLLPPSARAASMPECTPIRPRECPCTRGQAMLEQVRVSHRLPGSSRVQYAERMLRSMQGRATARMAAGVARHHCRETPTGDAAVRSSLPGQ